jgi:hypothetical protein
MAPGLKLRASSLEFWASEGDMTMTLSATYDVEVLVKMYEEHTTQGRHIETQRAQTMNFLFVLLVSVIAFLGADKIDPSTKSWIVWLIPVLGVFGAIIVTVYRDKWERSMALAAAHRQRLDVLCPDLFIEIDREAARRAYHGKIPAVLRWRLFAIWYGLCALMFFGGLLWAINYR